jgi:hypothetical protein
LSMYALSMYVVAAKTRCLDSYLKEINQIQAIPSPEPQPPQQP